MKTTILGGLLSLLAVIGCRQATSTSPGIETYTVECDTNQLVVGNKQSVEILVRYHRGQQPAATLKYHVQLRGPGDLTIAPPAWDVRQNLAREDAGFNYTAAVHVQVAPDATPGVRELTVIITPERGETTTRVLTFQVTNKER